MKVKGRYYVYILRCADGHYYTGITNDIERRLEEHAEGINITCYTFKRRPVELLYTEIFHEVTEAITREKQIQKWSRAKKEALMRGDVPSLQYHAMNSAIKKDLLPPPEIEGCSR